MPISQTIIKTGEIFWCEPDPADTVGSEQEKDRPWVVISLSHLHRGKCVVGVPLSKQMNKGIAHLITIPAKEIKMDGGATAYECVALTDQIRALDKTRFRKKAGYMTQRGLDAVLSGLERLFGM
jgi:mRNA-degrading endonuclease toxin of MazEF toxin-antitoxin module